MQERIKKLVGSTDAKLKQSQMQAADKPMPSVLNGQPIKKYRLVSRKVILKKSMPPINGTILHKENKQSPRWGLTSLSQGSKSPKVTPRARRSSPVSSASNASNKSKRSRQKHKTSKKSVLNMSRVYSRGGAVLESFTHAAAVKDRGEKSFMRNKFSVPSLSIAEQRQSSD